MTIYNPTKFMIPNGLDEIGLRVGLNRFEHESLSDYRKRLLLEARDRSGPTEQQFIKSLGRKVGQFDIPVFEIDLVLDVNDQPLAADAYVEITSTHFRAYHDYENNLIDIEINLLDRDNGYFLKDLNTALTASTYFSHTILDTDYTYKRSDKLRFDNSNRFVRAEFLQESRSNKLAHNYIKELYPQNPNIFLEEVYSLIDLDSEGKFYIDYVNGVVFTYEYATGIVAYTYRDFPFRIWWQPVRAWPYNNSDNDYKLKDDLISDEIGEGAPLLLNSDGAYIANQVILVHSLTWGN